jgi:pimeloyl-ACP methyl ester carboxylesterase
MTTRTAPPIPGGTATTRLHMTRTHRPALSVGLSLLAGLLAAVALVAGPFAGSRESVITGALLLGFASGWALLAALTTRFNERPQRWAAVPATAMALTGAALIAVAPGPAALSSLGWIWPPLLLALVVWMIVHARRRPTGRLQPWLLYPVFAVLALAALGGAYETVRNATDPALAAGGRLVDVGGHRLNLRCSGSGSPTVILEPGLGESSRAMARWIVPAVARDTRICVYDQAGHGRSDAAPAVDAARDLHVLLDRAHVPGPYVIAGHSLGGMFALSYAHRYPEQIAGIALLDSMHPRQHYAFGRARRVLAVVPTLARSGLARLAFDRRDGKPTAQALQLTRDITAMPAELDRAAELTTHGDRPLAVLSAGTGSLAGWADQQNDLARLSTNSTHRTISSATHASLIEDRTDAAQSSQTIVDVVKAARWSRQKFRVGPRLSRG